MMQAFWLRQAASNFRRQRATYYQHLADLLEAGGGDIKILQIFEKDAVRHGKTSRAVLSALWAERYATNGANLSDAWRGTLPDDEVAIIDVAQTAGAGALLAALRDVARIASLSDRVKRQSIGTLIAAFVGVSVAMVMLTVYPVFASNKLQEMYSFIPLNEWGPRGRFFNAWAGNVKTYGLYFAMTAIVASVYIHWTFNNLTGPIRDWLDRNVAVYRVVRDVKGALFLATMATLTRRRGNTMYTLSKALTTFARSIRSPWLRWRVQEINEGVNQTGAIGTSAFDTNLLSPEMYFFLVDMHESKGFAEGFEATGRYVEGTILDQILKRMTVYRWALLLLAMGSVLGVLGTQMSVIYEMKDTMMTYYGSR